MALPTIKRDHSGWVITWPTGHTTTTTTFDEARAEVLYCNDLMEQQRAEQAAEAAWLHAAEATTDADLAFEAWERGRGCAADPQSGY